MRNGGRVSASAASAERIPYLTSIIIKSQMQYLSTSDQSKQQPHSSEEDSQSDTNSKDKGIQLSKKKLEYL